MRIAAAAGSCPIPTTPALPQATPKRTRVLIADDHPFLREGLRALLATQSDLELVGEAEDGRKAVECARRLRPDVILMDIGMPACDGIKATRRIAEFLPKCAILALSSYGDEHSVERMLSAGASGYVTKTQAPDDLLQAVREVATLRRPANGKAAAKALRPFASSPLSHYEKQVLKLIAEGLRNREIAVRLGEDECHVATIRQRILRKLNIHNVADLTRFAITTGWANLYPGH